MSRVADSPGRFLRPVRALALAAVALALGLGGHAAVPGAATPPAAVVAVTAAALLALSWVVTARRAGLPAIVTALVAGQVAVHAGAALAGAHHGHAAGGSLDLAAFLCGLHPAQGPEGASAFGVVAMVAAHAAATALCAWWLCRGEALVWRGAVAGIRAVARVLSDVASPRAWPRRGGGTSWAMTPAELVTASAVAARAVTRRGPPGAAARA